MLSLLSLYAFSTDTAFIELLLEHFDKVLLVFADRLGLLKLSKQQLIVLFQLLVLLLKIHPPLARLQLLLQLFVLYFLQTQVVLQQFSLK